MSGRVPPSSRANSRHAWPFVSKDAKQAASRYSRFTGHEPENIGSINIPPLPKSAAVIGELDGVMYTTVRDGRVEKYIHEFKGAARPLLCTSPDGKQLLIVGGKYLFTERGIVDKNR